MGGTSGTGGSSQIEAGMETSLPDGAADVPEAAANPDAADMNILDATSDQTNDTGAADEPLDAGTD